MWTTERSIETTASAEAIWRLWADVPGWPDWIADVAHAELSGPFAVGSVILMTPIGQDPAGAECSGSHGVRTRAGAAVIAAALMTLAAG